MIYIYVYIYEWNFIWRREKRENCWKNLATLLFKHKKYLMYKYIIFYFLYYYFFFLVCFSNFKCACDGDGWRGRPAVWWSYGSLLRIPAAERPLSPSRKIVKRVFFLLPFFSLFFFVGPWEPGKEREREFREKLLLSSEFLSLIVEKEKNWNDRECERGRGKRNIEALYILEETWKHLYI